MAFKEDWSFLDKITMGAVGIERNTSPKKTGTISLN